MITDIYTSSHGSQLSVNCVLTIVGFSDVDPRRFSFLWAMFITYIL